MSLSSKLAGAAEKKFVSLADNIRAAGLPTRAEKFAEGGKLAKKVADLKGKGQFSNLDGFNRSKLWDEMVKPLEGFDKGLARRTRADHKAFLTDYVARRNEIVARGERMFSEMPHFVGETYQHNAATNAFAKVQNANRSFWDLLQDALF